MSKYVSVVSDKKKWTAFWLCTFLGMFGIHRFYVRRYASGLLFMFTMGGFFIGAIIDWIAILFGNFRDGDGLRVRR